MHITTNKYLVHVLVVLLHVRFSVSALYLFYWPPFFFLGHPYIGSTTVLPDTSNKNIHFEMILDVGIGEKRKETRFLI